MPDKGWYGILPPEDNKRPKGFRGILPGGRKKRYGGLVDETAEELQAGLVQGQLKPARWVADMLEKDIYEGINERIGAKWASRQKFLPNPVFWAENKIKGKVSSFFWGAYHDYMADRVVNAISDKFPNIRKSQLDLIREWAKIGDYAKKESFLKQVVAGSVRNPAIFNTLRQSMGRGSFFGRLGFFYKEARMGRLLRTFVWKREVPGGWDMYKWHRDPNTGRWFARYAKPGRGIPRRWGKLARFSRKLYRFRTTSILRSFFSLTSKLLAKALPALWSGIVSAAGAVASAGGALVGAIVSNPVGWSIGLLLGAALLVIMIVVVIIPRQGQAEIGAAFTTDDTEPLLTVDFRQAGGGGFANPLNVAQDSETSVEVRTRFTNLSTSDADNVTLKDVSVSPAEKLVNNNCQTPIKLDDPMKEQTSAVCSILIKTDGDFVLTVTATVSYTLKGVGTKEIQSSGLIVVGSPKGSPPCGKPHGGTVTLRFKEYFGKSIETMCGQSIHTGVDIAAGRTSPLRSTLKGVVTHKGSGGACGPYPGAWECIVVSNGVYSILYGHILPYYPADITVGAEVNVGDVIAYEDSTGYVVGSGGGDGSHVHYMAWQGGAGGKLTCDVLIDPEEFFSCNQ